VKIIISPQIIDDFMILHFLKQYLTSPFFLNYFIKFWKSILNNKNLMLLVNSFLLIIVSCAFVIEFKRYNKKVAFYKNEMMKLTDKLIETGIEHAEYERRRIAKDLHDEISIYLTVIKLNLTKISRNPQTRNISEPLIKESTNLLDASLQSIRNISKSITSPTLLKLGYEKGISELCHQINASKQIKVNCIQSFREIRQRTIIEMQMYRITYEILNNIIKHSNTSEIDVFIKSDEQGVSTVICYSGIGITSEMAVQLAETDQGAGLKNTRDRAKLINASIQYTMVEKNLYKTTIDVPIYV
jgi:signal transduction histidine kinase